jgi:hypothetical protein
MKIKFVFMLVSLSFIFCPLVYSEEKVTTKDEPPVQSIETRLKASYVCMMDNKYKGKDQIPVEVNGKTYYGCCQGCVSALKFNSNLRYAKDPLTGEEVDKADAYIVLSSDGISSDSSGSVLYFKSAEGYAKYLKSLRE